jgi:hypothetical protein
MAREEEERGGDCLGKAGRIEGREGAGEEADAQTTGGECAVGRLGAVVPKKVKNAF